MKDFSTYWDRYGTVCILTLIVLLFGSQQPEVFLSYYNFEQVLVQSSTIILMSMGEFFTILIAGIDLSVGSIIAITGLVSAKLMLMGIHPILATFLGFILLGMFIGGINGILVNFTGLHPFIITIGSNAILRGIILIISDARSVYGFPIEFNSVVNGKIGHVPVPVIIVVVMAVLLWFFSTNTRVGRNIYAMGGNREAAFFSGIDIKKHTLLVFIISGLCSGVAGMVNLGRVGAAEPLAGEGFEVFAIAATIIGGTSFFGGKGRILSVVVGGLIIAVISNGLNILNVPTFYQQIFMGALIIASVTLDKIIGERKKTNEFP